MLEDLGRFKLDKKLSQGINAQEPILLDPEASANQKDINNTNIPEESWISLRRLKNAEIIDYEGGFVGNVRTVIYGNNEVQGLYFELCQSLKQFDNKPLYIPFNALQFVENASGLKVMLTKAQTQSLARCLFTKESRKDRKN